MRIFGTILIVGALLMIVGAFANPASSPIAAFFWLLVAILGAILRVSTRPHTAARE